MRIDLHCHTKKVKSGEADTRNVEVEKFIEKIVDSNVKIVAITNHNHFDYPQYKEFRDSVDEYCAVWPGVELDIQGVKGKYHLIIIANPTKAEQFNNELQGIFKDQNPEKFSVGLKEVFNSLDNCDVLYIPHFHKEPRISNEDIEELDDLLKDKSRLFKETSDYRSLGVFSNFEYSVIIGSDNHDWDNYEKSKFADIRLPIQTFEQFCLLAKKDKVIIDTLLNKKRCSNIFVSPHSSVKFQLPIYEDINVLFGQKGTGKSEIISSLKRYYEEMNINYLIYVGNEKENDFKKLLANDDMRADPIKLGISSLKDEFKELYEWKDEIPTSLDSYIEWINTKDHNKNKSKMKITNAVKLEQYKQNRKFDQDYKKIESILEQDFDKLQFEEYLSEAEKATFKLLLNKLIENISKAKYVEWRDRRTVKLSNWSIDKIKSIADKCSDTVSKPSTTGFSEFVNNRFRLYELAELIENAFQSKEYSETEYLGLIEEKGDIFIQSNYKILCSQSRAPEFNKKIGVLKEFKRIIEKLVSAYKTDELFECLQKYHELYEDGIKDISHFIGLSKDTVLADKTSYQPSSGERGILVLQRMLASEADVYLLDEPELGMGNSYINASILPKLVYHAKKKKTVVVATHNANIAVRTLPYTSVLRTHENGEYSTYVGNPFRDDLVNIKDSNDYKNWTYESMHTLEGGIDAFYERKDIYESGTKNS